MPALLTARAVVLAKIESSYGVDPTPATSANEVEVFDLGVKVVSDKVERKPLRASISPQPIKRSRKTYEITFTTELKGSGTAGTAGRLSPLFKACGMTETVSAGSSVTYAPGNPTGSCTIYVYKDGLLFKSLGCRGTFEINVEAGRIPQVKWTFRGTYAIPTDTSLPTPTYEATIGQVAESTSTTFSGFSAGVVRNYSIDIGNEVIVRPNLNSGGAVIGVIIGTRTPAGKMLLEAELRATEDIWSDWDLSTAFTFSSVIGVTAGNIVTITSTSNAQWDEVTPADESGIFMYDGALVFSGTDNEFSVKLT